MNPRAEAIARVDGRYDARVLEPSPPAVADHRGSPTTRSAAANRQATDPASRPSPAATCAGRTSSPTTPS